MDAEAQEVFARAAAHLALTGFPPPLDAELWSLDAFSQLLPVDPDSILDFIPSHDTFDPAHRAAAANWVYSAANYWWGADPQGMARAQLRRYLASVTPDISSLPLLRWELYAAAVARDVTRVLALSGTWERHDPDFLDIQRLARTLLFLMMDRDMDFPDWAWDFDVSRDSETAGLEAGWDIIALLQACGVEHIEALWSVGQSGHDSFREAPLVCLSMLERLGPTRLDADVVVSAIVAWANCSIAMIEGHIDSFRTAAAGYRKLAHCAALPLGDVSQDFVRQRALRAATYCWVKAKDFANAERHAREWVAVAPEDAEAHRQLAQCLYNQLRIPECLDALEAALRLREDDEDDWSSSLFLKLSLESRNSRRITEAIENTAFISQCRSQGEALTHWMSPWTANLCPAAAQKWWVGLHIVSSQLLQNDIGESSAREEAGAAFGEAVSVQVRHAVAKPFAAEISQQFTTAFKPDEYWSKFLAGKATLGNQLSCLLQTRNPNHELARRLQKWLATNARALSDHLRSKGNSMMILAELRGDALHDTITPERLRRLYDEAESLLKVMPR
jgi:tetratricopeptide (TPR) repeat protein